MKVNIFLHIVNSKGGVALADALNIKRIKHKNSRFRGNPDKIVINWGASELPNQVERCRVINPAYATRAASDKILTFERMMGSGVSIPPWFTDRQTATIWMRGKAGRVLVCRTLTRASAGKGIVIAEDIDEIVNAPLYTGYVKKQSEFRVHVLAGKVIDRQRKARNKEVLDEDVNWRVRTHDNGFIYMREDVIYPEGIDDEAIKAVDACSLDFGAVDIIYNTHEDKCYVLEINSAPGLEGQSVETYAKAFNDFLLDN